MSIQKQPPPLILSELYSFSGFVLFLIKSPTELTGLPIYKNIWTSFFSARWQIHQSKSRLFSSKRTLNRENYHGWNPETFSREKKTPRKKRTQKILNLSRYRWVPYTIRWNSSTIIHSDLNLTAEGAFKLIPVFPNGNVWKCS